jgi:DNA-binding LytR/AlgR family response regulator
MMKEKWNHLLCQLNQKLILFLGIGLGATLFVIVFEPFHVEQLNFEDRILFASGFGIIIFLIIFLTGIAYPSFVAGDPQEESYPELRLGIRNFLIWFLCSLSVSFYLIFTRTVSLTTFDIYKIALICILPPVIIGIHDKLLQLREKNEALLLLGEILQSKMKALEADESNKPVDFISENKAEKFSLLSSNILFIKSADNYAEIHYLDGDQVKKRLIRNTLKNIEVQIKNFPNLIRCHRISIVNSHNIEKLIGNCNNQALIIKGVDEKIPVSRSYIMKIKEAL